MNTLQAKTNHSHLLSDPAIPSSSPAFATPQHVAIPPRPRPALPQPVFKPATVLPVQLPPATLRPLAVRLFSRKHNLTLSTGALMTLAAFVGKQCGSGWKSEGLAEGVLEEVARLWKRQGGGSIVNDDGNTLKDILKTVESCMSGGKVISGKKGLSRQASFAFGEVEAGTRPSLQPMESFGMSGLGLESEAQDDEDGIREPREWFKVINAYEQPRLVYNTMKKHFDRSKSKASLFPPPSHKTEMVRQRYHIVHQRILRNEGFQQQPMMGASRQANAMDGSAINKITPINNLLGRSDSSHLLLGLLTILPTGSLAISDLTGSIALDMRHARPFPDAASAYFCPGMILLVDGVYVEDGSGASESNLGSMGGIGATIGGKFLVSLMAHPPCEQRSTTLGIQEYKLAVGAAFGWTDFLGLGSEKALGPRMRNLQSRILGPESPHEGNGKIVIASEVNLDLPSSLTAIRRLFVHYASRPTNDLPMSIVLIGNFMSQPALTAVQGASSIDYKECFNNLAAVISDFPSVLAQTTLVFVPGDQDGWASAFSAGSATPLPRKAVPDLFTTRVRRVVAEANREARAKKQSGRPGEVVWTSNPARLTWFGCAGEMVLLRDDVSGRLRRSAVRFPKPDDSEDAGGEEDVQMADAPTDPDTVAARQLTKTLCDQAHLAPFPLSTRPVLWDYASSLQLYPLPTALVVADPEAPAFAHKYMGCCVMNPGRLVQGRRGERVSWMEYDVMANRGEIKIEGA